MEAGDLGLSRFIAGITGASGTIYGKRLVEVLVAGGHQVDLVVTEAGVRAWSLELGNADSGPEIGLQPFLELMNRQGPGTVKQHDLHNIAADIASGSVNVQGMAVVPCSMSAVSAIAHGLSSDLLERAADVTIKERRRLVLVPRESPLSLIHLRNMTTLAEMGVIIVPAAPAFYHKPKRIEELVDFIITRVLHGLGVKENLFKPWEGDE